MLMKLPPLTGWGSLVASLRVPLGFKATSIWPNEII